MNSVRRWYLFLVATISLQAVAWALISLLRNLLGAWGERSNEATAFQVAVIIIGLPVYLIHWLWAQRLAASDPDERSAGLRRLFLYGNMTAFLGPVLKNSYSLSNELLARLFDPNGSWDVGYAYGPPQTLAQRISVTLTPILLLGVLWLYHRHVANTDAVKAPLSGDSALIRRLYLFIFSFSGLVLVGGWTITLLRWVLYQLGDTPNEGAVGLVGPFAGLLVGLPLWVLFWRQAQQLFHGPDLGEHESALRKFYLHAVVFFSALTVVSALTQMLYGLLHGALGLKPVGDIRDPLPVVLGAAVIWAYHSLILRSDTALIAEVPRQAGVRRLSWYLVASIGLAATLGGLGSIISLLIRALSQRSFGDDLRNQLAWSLAALIAGLPIWVLIWRKAEGMARQSGPSGDAERASLVRRIYLYGFMLASTLTILSELVYIVFRLLRLVLGAASEGNLVADLAQGLAFSLIAAAVLVYHGSILRGEGRRRQAAQATRAAELRVAVLDPSDGSFGRAILERLRREVPGLTLSAVGLNPVAVAAMGAIGDPRGFAAQLAEAGLIIGPWQIILPQTTSAEIAQAVSTSPAQKLLLPTPVEGWDWAGVEAWSGDAALDQIVHGVRQTLSGEPIRPLRSSTSTAITKVMGGLMLVFVCVLVIIGIIAIRFLRQF